MWVCVCVCVCVHMYVCIHVLSQVIWDYLQQLTQIIGKEGQNWFIGLIVGQEVVKGPGYRQEEMELGNY